MTTPLSALNITQYFLYGQSDTPTKLTERLRDVPVNSTVDIDVTIQSYMSSYVGRYAVAARAEFVQRFFQGTAILPPGTYTVNSLIPTVGAESFSFSYQQSQVDLANNNYMERAYVFGHERFSLSGDTQFVVLSDGTRSISNLKIIPEDDNFDFVSAGPAQVYNETILIPTIDPYGIGRKVLIHYTGDPLPGTSYSASQYISDIAKVQGWDVSQAAGIAAVLAATPDFLGQLRTDGGYEYERNGRDIIYDGQGLNSVSASSGPNPTLGAILVAGSGNDLLSGSVSNDTLYGGSGNDIIISSAGSDDIWGRGEGEESGADGERDVVDYSQDPNPITISFDGGLTPSLKVEDGYGGEDTLHSVEKIIGTQGNDRFLFKGKVPDGFHLIVDAKGGQSGSIADAVNLDGASSAMRLFIDSKSNNGFVRNRDGGTGQISLVNFHTDIVGSQFNDVITDLSNSSHGIEGRGGDDVITLAGADGRIVGGAGNDSIHIRSEAATITFGVGDGADVVEFEQDGNYTLELENLNPSDIELIAGGRSLYSGYWKGQSPDGFWFQFFSIRVKATGDQVTFLENGRNVGPDGNGSAVAYNMFGDNGSKNKLDYVKFADNTVWNQNQLWDHLQLNVEPPDVTVKGEYWGYSDDYSPSYGEENVYYENFHTSISYLSYVNQTYFQASPIEAPPPPSSDVVTGTGSDDWLYPGQGDSTIDGGAGDDQIRESGGDDTYIWNTGDGHDQIGSFGLSDGSDTLQLGSGIAPQDISFAIANDGAGLTVNIAAGSGGSVTFNDQLVGDGFGVDLIRFANGTSWTRAQIMASASSAIAIGHQSITGTSGADYLFAPAGNYTLDGGAGDDEIYVFSSGSGTIRFGSTSGQDILYDWGTQTSRNDALELTDLNSADLTFARSGESLIMTVGSTGASLEITTQFKGVADGELHGLDSIQFADNTVWTRADIAQAARGGLANSAPVAQLGSANAIEDGSLVRGTLLATDADVGDQLRFKLSSPVAGLVIGSDGTWSFDATNPVYNNLKEGETLSVVANYQVLDQEGASGTSTLTINLVGTNDVPRMVHALTNRVVTNGEAFSFLIPTNTFDDPDGDGLTLTAALADGSDLPSWLSFSNGEFSGTAPVTGSSAFMIQVTAEDATTWTSSTFELGVTAGSELQAPQQLYARQLVESMASFGWRSASSSRFDLNGGESRQHAFFAKTFAESSFVRLV